MNWALILCGCVIAYMNMKAAMDLDEDNHPFGVLITLLGMYFYGWVFGARFIAEMLGGL